MNYLHQYDEKDLLTRLSEGDEWAFTLIYNQYHQTVYSCLIRFVKIPSIAEDLVHEVFLKLWEMRERLKIHTSLRAYLLKASRNKAIDMLHKIVADDHLRREIIRQLQPVIPEGFAVLQIQEYEAMLRHAVEMMPPQRKKVFRLCREEGRTYDEAAAELGISKNTVKEHMTQALRYIRKAVIEKGYFAIFVITLDELL